MIFPFFFYFSPLLIALPLEAFLNFQGAPSSFNRSIIFGTFSHRPVLLFLHFHIFETFSLDRRFFCCRFPEDKELRQKWITATGRNLTHSSIQARMAVCSAHFDKSCFATVGKVKLLSQDAVPTIDLPISKVNKLVQLF